MDKLPRKKQVNIWRKLYGYKQKAGNNSYDYKGMLTKYEGEKLANGIFLLPAKNKQIFEKFIKENKLGYSIYEFWAR